MKCVCPIRGDGALGFGGDGFVIDVCGLEANDGFATRFGMGNDFLGGTNGTFEESLVILVAGGAVTRNAFHGSVNEVGQLMEGGLGDIEAFLDPEVVRAEFGDGAGPGAASGYSGFLVTLGVAFGAGSLAGGGL